jgi:hypothetical protein
MPSRAGTGCQGASGTIRGPDSSGGWWGGQAGGAATGEFVTGFNVELQSFLVEYQPKGRLCGGWRSERLERADRTWGSRRKKGICNVVKVRGHGWNEESASICRLRKSQGPLSFSRSKASWARCSFDAKEMHRVRKFTRRGRTRPGFGAAADGGGGVKGWVKCGYPLGHAMLPSTLQRWWADFKRCMS